MDAVVSVVQSSRIRDLVAAAGRIGHFGVRVRRNLPEPGDRRRVRGAGLLVHDFRPDPAASVDRLRAWDGLAGAPAVFALLERPLTATLQVLAAGAPPVPLAALAVVDEIDAVWLAERTRDALLSATATRMVRRVGSEWWDEELLRLLAVREIESLRPHRTLKGLLRDAGVSRRRFIDATTRAGFERPLDFLHLIRAVRAVDLLRRGLPLTAAAQRLDYGSVATVRRHVNEVFGVSPSAVRRLSEDDLVGRAERCRSVLLPSRAG